MDPLKKKINKLTEVKENVLKAMKSTEMETNEKRDSKFLFEIVKKVL